MSHGSLKDTARSIQTAFAGAANTLSPLPDELQQTIKAFLERNPSLEESDAQKLHEELLAAHDKYVATSPDKLSAFVHVLRRLQPLLRGEKRLTDWWQLVIQPVLDSIGHKRETVEDAREFLFGILFDDGGKAGSDHALLAAKFLDLLLATYMSRSRVPSLEGQDLSPEDEFVAQEMESILIAYGKRQPLELLRAIDAEIVKKERRLHALSLLSSFVRLQPPHLHLVLETSIISHLHSCLLIDVSGTVVDLALTVLIMLLPHIASSLYSSMAKMFLIYARISCWEQQTAGPTDSPLDDEHADAGDEPSPDSDASSPALEVDGEWEPLDRLFNTVEAIVPKANYLFTFLYGMFPLNFMSFIRKPRRFLKSKNYPGADDLYLDQDLMRKRSEAYRSTHRLHPSFFTTTLEDELTDNRLLKMDAADLVTECLALSITAANMLNDPGPPPTAKLPELPKHARKHLTIRPPDALLALDDDCPTSATSPTVDFRSCSSWRNTQSSTSTEFYADTAFPMPPVSPRRETSPQSEGTEGSSSRPVSRQSRLSAQRKSPSMSGDVEPLPKLQAFAQSLSCNDKPGKTSGAADRYSVTLLQREVMLLKNDLNFERFQKAQYLAQIGQLQRKSVNQASTESQTQTLLNKNRTLAGKLKKTDDLYAQIKKEMAISRSQSKKYEEQLIQKMKLYREEEKLHLAEIQTLRHELELLKHECEKLRALVLQSEAKAMEARNELSTLSVDVEAMDKLKQQLQELENKVRQYELSELDVERAREDHDLLQTELETAQMTIESRDAELGRLRKTFEQKLVTLENRLRSTPKAPPASLDAPLPDSVQQMVDSALAASNAKYQQLRKNYKRLNERYIELEFRYKEAERNERSRDGSLNDFRRESVLSLTRYAEDDKLSVSSSSVSRGLSTRVHAFADSNTLMEEDFAADEEAYQPQRLRNPSIRSIDHAARPRFDSLANLKTVRSLSPPPPTRFASRETLHDFQAHSDQQSVTTPDLSALRKSRAPGEMRFHGRGGAQKVLRPEGEEKKKKTEKTGKSGGFRGLKGIM